jgi:hypothetical protein
MEYNFTIKSTVLLMVSLFNRHGIAGGSVGFNTALKAEDIDYVFVIFDIQSECIQNDRGEYLFLVNLCFISSQP